MTPLLTLPINDHFHLRQTVPDDAEETFAMVDKNREYLRPWMPWVDGVKCSADTKHHLEYIQVHSSISPEFVLVYHGKIIGRLGFHRIDEQNRNTSIGYWLDADHQGKGLMSMAVRAAVDYAFFTRNLHRLILMAAVENKPSRAIAARLGFQQEGIARDGEWLHNHFVDLVVYSILKTEWTASLPSAASS